MAKKSASADFREVMSDIKKGKFSPVYILMGEEDYFIDKITDALEENVVTEDEKDFNLSTYYGADSEVLQIISRSQQYPVMAPRQLVLLKEAQALHNAKNQLEKFASYIKHPNPSTVLVIAFKGDSLSASSDIIKAANNNTVLFRSNRVKDYQLTAQAADYCKEKQIAIDGRGIELLSEYIGGPISKLFGEIDKLIVAAGETRRITPQLIEDIIGISKEYNTFELIKTISKRDFVASMKILDIFSKNPKQNPGIVVTATLFNYFSKLFIASILKDKSDRSIMNELDLKTSFALEDYKNGIRNFSPTTIDNIIHELRRVDCQSKGIGSTKNEFDLLKELIFKIFTL